ncbi:MULTISPECIES: sugar ABC transporter permease [unclassified Streptomyces]|uniref:carbohydrate ABC transporter permease n=1 Tax=unclassified Streptomyces TaxID=2593676 RepID=UPI002DDAD214|nr:MULTISPECIES: sugar ABC transporter permease [unclassified Streptomyces]WSA90632.1 sugar ABC transporter permease [Streptomyces sp. NBC_01795]WSB74959.1 sugar ABC transporter permease [Streptomyces sp. NBC_01775]WSS16760.1 sugar ABC transporter permease [Streptomyces sp. NBC_01186]WSS45580.1 sugar ABC transporter permease [Streptomyces sp. NBC_01187]
MTVTTTVKTPAGPRNRRWRERGALSLLLGPSVLLIVVFVIAPACYGIYLGLTDTQLTGWAARDPQFVGLENFRHLLGSEDFLASLGRTGEFVFWSAIVGQTVLGMFAALLLRAKWLRGKGLFGALVLLPMVVPEVVASLTWASVLSSDEDGTFNRLLGLFGSGAAAPLQDSPMLSVIIINVWRGIALAMIMFQAALEDVPDELIEASRMDGASALQVFRYVTLPLIRGPVFLYLLLTTITTVGVFGLVYFLTQGGPGQDTELSSIYIFQRAFKYSQIGLGSAVSVVLLVLLMILGLTYARLAKVKV